MRLVQAVSTAALAILFAGCTDGDSKNSTGTGGGLFDDIEGETGERSPSFNLNADQSNARLKIDSAVENADWNRLQFKSNKAIVFNKDAAATTGAGTDVAVNTWTEITGSADVMVVGEYIDFCGGTKTTPAAQTDVIIEMRDGEANSAKGEWTFPSVALCGAT